MEQIFFIYENIFTENLFDINSEYINFMIYTSTLNSEYTNLMMNSSTKVDFVQLMMKSSMSTETPQRTRGFTKFRGALLEGFDSGTTKMLHPKGAGPSPVGTLVKGLGAGLTNVVLPIIHDTVGPGIFIDGKPLSFRTCLETPDGATVYIMNDIIMSKKCHPLSTKMTVSAELFDDTLRKLEHQHSKTVDLYKYRMEKKFTMGQRSISPGKLIHHKPHRF